MSSKEASALIGKKRERTQNWVPEEKRALFSLIELYASAIENKKIDATASATKIHAWQMIHSRFQKQFSTDRDITRMREQWRRIKTQARTEIYTFAEKLRTMGPEEATRIRPSNLSIDVWRLLENVRKNDCDADHSDESGEDTNILSLEKEASLSNFLLHEIKQIKPDEDFQSKSSDQGLEEEKIENNEKEIDRETPSDDSKKQKKPRFDDDQVSSYINDELMQDLCENKNNFDNEANDLSCKTLKHKAIWLFGATQKEFDLKFKILNTELERAEFQKQTAFNEWKTAEIKRKLAEGQIQEYNSQVRMAGEPGSGAGKGGGGGGSIREAGGSFGKMEAAKEDQYFYNLQKEQIRKLREELHDEISFHEEQIKRHQESINRHKKRISDMDKK